MIARPFDTKAYRLGTEHAILKQDPLPEDHISLYNMNYDDYSFGYHDHLVDEKILDIQKSWETYL